MTRKEATIVIEKADIATALGMSETVNQREFIEAKVTLAKSTAPPTIGANEAEIRHIRSLKGAARLEAVTAARKRLGLPVPFWSAKHGAMIIVK